MTETTMNTRISTCPKCAHSGCDNAGTVRDPRPTGAVAFYYLCPAHAVKAEVREQPNR